MNKYTIRQSFILLLTATIWGVAFVAQSVGMEYVGPFTFNAVRNCIGGLVLLPVIALMKKYARPDEERKEDKKILFTGGITIGVLLFVATSFQQIGIQSTSVGKTGFITAMYIVLVPLFGLFFHKRAGVKLWIGVALALCGMYLLCMKSGEASIQKGDVLIFFCAVTFSFHILTVDHFSPLVNGVKMSCIQFFTCSFLSCIFMFIFENPKISSILAAWLPILYAGLLSCGVGYTLQIVGQKGLNPTIASLIMSLESVISLLAGWILLGQKLSNRELLGCVIVFLAIILVQLPDRQKS